MGRSPCCDKTKVKKGPWSPEEDVLLRNFIMKFGNGGNWISLPKKAGLNRCGKSCRLRWLNYLRPNIKHGDFTDEEDRVIYTLYHTVGSRWSVIAASLPGRTDNDVKNYWNTKLRRKISAKKFQDAILNDSTSNNYGFLSIYDSQHLELGVGATSSKLEQHQLTLEPRKNDNFVAKGDECHDLSCSTSSTVSTQEICSQNSGSFSLDTNQNNFTSVISSEDELWMELFSESFDDVAVASKLVEDKISEIASLLDDFC